jgi:hypothetical protein
VKRFQAALKLHSQGPRFFDEAADAYDDLFKSEIFQYPEATTEYEKTENPSKQLALETAALEISPNEADGPGSSLPQALYLSYKNHGQFFLDRIKYRSLKTDERTNGYIEGEEVRDQAGKALSDFSAALDQDPADAELWRRSARVAAFLKSSRISRYCLEAAIELDDDPAVVEFEPPSLAEGLAGEQLKEHLRTFADEMALSHPIMTSWVEKEMPSMLKRQLDPLPFLSDHTKTLSGPETSELLPATIAHVIELPELSWSDLGMALVGFVNAEGSSRQAITIDIPVSPTEEIEEASPAPSKSSPAPETTSNGDQTEKSETASGPPAKDLPPQSPELSRKERSVSIPSRKRSQSTAGVGEGGDEDTTVEKRSKRIRRRDTAAEELMDPSTLHATNLASYQAADRNLFQMTKDMLENLGVTDKITLERIGQIIELCTSEDRATKIQNVATNDFRNSIMSFNDDDAKTFLSKKEQSTLGLSSFLEHAKTGSHSNVHTPAFDEKKGLRSFINRINSCYMTIHDLAYEWLRAVSSSYTTHKWSDGLKTAIVQVISRLDEDIYANIQYRVQEVQDDESDALHEVDRIVQMLFELHLDIYERITNPSSVVDYCTRVETKSRLERWLDLAAERGRCRDPQVDTNLSVRFIWAAIFSTTVAQVASRDHILQCWTSLREYLVKKEAGQILLPNNAVMPDISPSAADREISKLTTMEFFLGLFQEDMSDPVSVIENLEPVLNPAGVFVPSASRDLTPEDGSNLSTSRAIKKTSILECASPELRDLWKFLEGSNTEVRLFLWSRLGDAYKTIKYSTKQLSCLFKSIEMIVTDLEKDSYLNISEQTRRLVLLKMLKAVDDLVIKSLELGLNDSSAFDIIDEDHLRSTASALCKLSCMLHVAPMIEDEVRIGMTPAPASGATFHSFINRFREIQVRTWSLQYAVLRFGIQQNKAIFKAPENDQADYLSAIHQVLGLRKYCKSSNKIFLKMMRQELLKLKNIENWEDYLGQVLYDLHGIKLGVGVWEVQDHGCPTEKLEKRNAMQLVEKVTLLASRMPLKDLLKSDLKITIDHIAQAIGQPKSSPQMMHNFLNFKEYIKRPIHPLTLYQALSGGITLDGVNVNSTESGIAKHGWFFLQGLLALTKFKAVDLNRRQTPSAIDDLRIATISFRQQLQLTPDRWDAFFRCGECFDYELDEAVLWSADKMNKDRGELITLQRSTIHCYTLALSHSWNADTDSEFSDGLYELYHNFGMRLYASSREPFAMEPFHHQNQERFFIQNMGVGTYKKIVHEQMSDYKVWKFAAGLFRKAASRNPKDWK